MRRRMKNPADGDGGVLKCLPGRLDTLPYSTVAHELKHLMRASFLRRRHGLSGSRAALVAGLVYDGGAR